MAILTFNYRTIGSGGTPQPLVGSTTSAAITASPTPQAVAVADSSIFDPGDRLYVDVNQNSELVTLTAVGNNTISAVFTLSHASGVFLTLFQPITNFFVQEKPGNTGTLYFFAAPNQFKRLSTYGRSSLSPSKSTLACGLFILLQTPSGTQPMSSAAANNYGANPDNACFLWVDGTTGDGYLPWLGIT